MTQVHDTPSEITAHRGTVLMDGPGGLATALTPEAADETAYRLHQEAAQAKGQQITGQAAMELE